MRIETPALPDQLSQDLIAVIKTPFLKLKHLFAWSTFPAELQMTNLQLKKTKMCTHVYLGLFQEEQVQMYACLAQLVQSRAPVLSVPLAVLGG